MKVLGLVLCGVLVAGCGLRGDLERAPPLWGDAAKAEFERERARGAEKPPAPDRPVAPETQTTKP